MDLRSYLRARREELLLEIAPLRESIAEAQRRLAVLESELVEVEASATAIGMVNGLERGAGPARPSLRQPSVREGTIKDYVIQVLADRPDGMAALDILAAISERFSVSYKRPSLSPQLSRLRQEGVIDRRGLIWFLTPAERREAQKEKGSGGDPPEPLNVGDVAERSIAPDSKSGGADPGKLAPVGSNPTVSAPIHRAREDLLAGTSLLSAPTTPLLPPWEGKKGG